MKRQKSGAVLIAEERKRQIKDEGWSEVHDDDEHNPGDLAIAGCCYATNAIKHFVSNFHKKKLKKFSRLLWPWDDKWWKPTPNDRKRQLVKAGALIAAEIDRMNRCPDDYP